MNEYEDSRHDLNENPPDNFEQQDELYFFLRYDIDRNNGEPIFSYRLATSQREESKSMSGRDQTSWSPFRFVSSLVRDLDIRVYADTLVTMELELTHNYQKFFWSKDRKAIKTRSNHQDLYGHLLYEQEGGSWARDNDGRRTKIQFKAKRAAGPRRSHKFSCNVRFLATDNFLEEYEIDPDIKNPTV